MSNITSVSFKELDTLKGIDITQTIQEQIDAISGGGGALPENYIWVGDALGQQQGVAMSGGASIVSSGLLTLGTNYGYATTATAAASTTLTVTSKALQFFTGSTTQTVVLPVTSTLALGWKVRIANNSTGALTVNSSGGNLVATVAASTDIEVTCIAITGTDATSWATSFTDARITARKLTGFVSGAGTVAETDSILVGFNKINGNIAANTSSISSLSSSVGALAHIPINTQTDSYTLVLTDDGKLIDMNKGTANDLTVPLNATVAFPVGTQISVRQKGAGTTTIVATGGVTLQSLSGLILQGQFAFASLVKLDTDTWAVVGALTS